MKIKNLLLSGILVFVSMGSFAQNNSPTAPEASSFEALDATDMVNLATGDLSYVLPLLNIPSPEGGYPISLSYHAGIAMDQEASWVGLGWNLNPGAINRSVNGYPDDWKKTRIEEYFYDVGGTDTYTNFSIGYTSFSTGGLSVGLSLSFKNSRAIGGDVSLGMGIGGGGSVGINAGSSGVGLSGNYQFGNTSIGANIGSNGVGLSFGLSGTKNSLTGNPISGGGASIGISSTWDGKVGANLSFSGGMTGKMNSLGINITSDGVNLRGGVLGASVSSFSSFEQSVSSNDYIVEVSTKGIGIGIPTGEGMINLGFSRTKVKYELDKLSESFASGPLYMDKGRGDGTVREYCCVQPYYSHTEHDWTIYACGVNDPDEGPNYHYRDVTDKHNLMDISEIGVNQDLDRSIRRNNAVFPNFDNYSVSAEGLSGSISPKMYEVGPLTGLRKEGDPYGIIYVRPDNPSFEDDLEQHHSTRRINFYFDGENTTSSTLEPSAIGYTSNTNSVFSYINSNNAQLTRQRGSKFIETYTNWQIGTNNYDVGLLKPSQNFSYNTYDADGIGAFKITAADGKVYHYSLPVQNHEIIYRKFGVIDERPNENQAFFEKRQLKPYATHWLLTAVTGPDFIDMNNNSVADEGDYGYWVSFDYGKWSDGFIWYDPYDQDYNENIIYNGVVVESVIKDYTWGRKEIYYLDKIKTRTHTALFVKELREDGKGKELTFSHRFSRNHAPVNFHFHAERLLKLKDILLLKNEDAESISKTNVSGHTSPLATGTNTYQWMNGTTAISKTVNYSLQDNVLDTKDFSASDYDDLIANSLKVIDFSDYDYALANGTPNSDSGRLTLNGVSFLGKGGASYMPPYKFSYNNFEGFNIDNEDDWGYNKEYTSNWSLKDITNPEGGKINISYESDEFISANRHAIYAHAYNGLDYWTQQSGGTQGYLYKRANRNPDFEFAVGDYVNVNFFADRTHVADGFYYIFNGIGIIEADLAFDPSPYPEVETRFRINFIGNVETYTEATIDKSLINDDFTLNISKTIPYSTEFEGGGLRVKKIDVTDGVNTYSKEYTFNKHNSTQTSGVTSYVPQFDNPQLDIAYGPALPAPVVLYSDVTVKSFDANGGNDHNEKTHYKFKTLELKETNDIKFGETFEINSNESTYTETNKKVSLDQIEIIDNSSSLGQLLSMEYYNEEDQLLRKVENHYKAKEDITQGIRKESFDTHKIVNYNEGIDYWMINTSTRTKYPTVLESTTVHEGGFSSTTYFNKFDPNTGQVTETLSEDSNGNSLKTEITPAYTVPAYNPSGGYGMGSKVDDVTNRNMLTQQAMSKSYIDINGQWKETGVGITTWNNDWAYYESSLGGDMSPSDDAEKIWRKHKSFTWDGDINPDGTFKDFHSSTDDDFNWSLGVNVPQSNDKWKNISTSTRYDHYSMPLEVKDINDNYVTTKMCDDDSKVLFTSNSKYYESMYTGFEYLNEPQTSYFYGLRTTQYAHTGNYSLTITPSTYYYFSAKFKNNQFHTGQYKISAWVHKDNYQDIRYQVTGGQNSSPQPFNGEVVFAGDWVLMNHYAYLMSGYGDLSVRIISDNETVYMDDFKIHPIASTMTSYVYNEWDELTDILGANNLATHFVYDEAGRLKETYNEVVDNPSLVGGFKLASRNSINYKGQAYGSLSSEHQIVSTDCNNDFYIQIEGSLGVVQNWDIDFGDGTSQQGTGSPPATISHSYTTAGQKTVTMTATNSSGFTTSFDTEIQVAIAYYFTIANQGHGYKNLILHGTPGEPIVYSATTGGSNSSYHGSVSVNGVSSDLPTNGSQVNGVQAGNFPESGQVNVNITVSENGTGAGSTNLIVERAGDCNPVTTNVSVSYF